MVGQGSHINPSMKGRSTPLLQMWPSKLINCNSILRAQCLHIMSLKGEGREKRWAHLQRTDGRLLDLASLHPHYKSPQGRAQLTERGFANTMLDKHSCIRSFWHLFIIKDHLTWMAGETDHLFLKIGLISFLQKSACTEWCFKNTPRHSANTEAFPFPAGQG